MLRYSTKGTRSIFYGWIIVGAVFLMSATAAGIIYSFPAFVSAFSAEFGVGRAEISAIFAVSEFVWFMTGFGAGFIADRFGPRKVGMAGAAVMGAGLLAAANAPSLTFLYLSYGLGVGIGGGMIYVPAVGLVQRWFRRKRGLASGMAVCGTGIGTLCFPPLAVGLLDQFGWRTAHMILGVCVVVICGIASSFLIHHPNQIGLEADGEPVGSSSKSASSLSGLQFGEALRQPHFWLLYTASLLSAAAVFINYVHLVPFATDNGISVQRGIALVSILGISGTCGRFLLGGLSDSLGRRAALLIFFLGLSLSMIWWLLAPPVFWSLCIYASVFGALYGGYIALLPALTMEYFGGRRITTIIGALYTSWGFGALLGPTIAGRIYDATGGYSLAIILGALLMAISAACCAAIREPAIHY